jgi:hypothetical protein
MTLMIRSRSISRGIHQERIRNGLPAPDGPFYAIYRVYMPGETVINGTWKKPPMQAVAAK